MKQVMDGCERNFYRACNLLHKVVYYIHTPPRDVPTVTPTYTARTLLFMWYGTPRRISWHSDYPHVKNRRDNSTNLQLIHFDLKEKDSDIGYTLLRFEWQTTSEPVCFPQ